MKFILQTCAFLFRSSASLERIPKGTKCLQITLAQS